MSLSLGSTKPLKQFVMKQQSVYIFTRLASHFFNFLKGNTMHTEQLKSSLKHLHTTLSGATSAIKGEEVDAELADLLKTLQEDIGQLLSKERIEDDGLSHLGDRSLALSAKFAAQHPVLEKALRDLAERLASIGI